MAQVLENLQREVQEARDVQSSAVALITGLKSKIDDLSNNATELSALKSALGDLSQELSDSTDSLAAAVTTDAGGGDAPTPTDPTPGTGDGGDGDNGGNTGEPETFSADDANRQ